MLEHLLLVVTRLFHWVRIMKLVVHMHVMCSTSVHVHAMCTVYCACATKYDIVLRYVQDDSANVLSTCI